MLRGGRGIRLRIVTWKPLEDAKQPQGVLVEHVLTRQYEVKQQI